MAIWAAAICSSKHPRCAPTIRNIAAHYSLANGNVTLRDFRASLLGGEVTAQGTMKDISGNSHSEITAVLAKSRSPMPRESRRGLRFNAGNRPDRRFGC